MSFVMKPKTKNQLLKYLRTKRKLNPDANTSPATFEDTQLLASGECLEMVIDQAQRSVNTAAAERDAALAKLEEAMKQPTERDAASTELEKLKKQLTVSEALA
ncbi:hypothetical protein GUJ93_ZPchr0261g29022 [Zizania palustris]|uniref:Uncharacterized protein n=1 Tax=Zizania palustris TaxID=103762 RepID=A0A8J5QZ24_ZIZPA|nr:hypothetical protein GUJ93_ZPchr0261g29022 [Zizania palustris]